MKRLSDEIIRFFKSQSFVIVTTSDRDGTPHSACKGIVEINEEGLVYLLDLYRGRTLQNLQHNRRIAVTAVDEHKFKGFCLKGKGSIARAEELAPGIMHAWEEKITSRITQRVLKNLHEGKGHPRHPEALLPKPAYMIVMETEEAVDLTPHHIKRHEKRGEA